MTVHHGNTPAAWTFVVIFLIGFTVASIAVILRSWPVGLVGVVIVAISPVVGKIMQRMGYGAGA
jgi:hypothetical protein